MPRVSINLLTKNRPALLEMAIKSVVKQSYREWEIVLVNDGSTDATDAVIESFIREGIQINNIKHDISLGISASRQEALVASQGEYIAILDDDDEWLDVDKLKKQVHFLDSYPEAVLCGGSIKIKDGSKNYEVRVRPQTDEQIRQSMLFRNNFFTSTVMLRRDAALAAGGFIKDGADLAEDYDLWLRLGKMGQLHNLPDIFTQYRRPNYDRQKFQRFLDKQLSLISHHKTDYPYYRVANLILRLRLLF